MVVLDCHFPLSCRQGYTLCCIHYVDNGTQISCISCRHLKLHYKFMYELTRPFALLILFALIVLEKWIYNIFVIWWPSLDCTGLNKICVGTLSYTHFIHNGFPWFFCSEPMFWKGSKTKPQFYCKDMVNPMQWHHQPIATVLWVL
jgi:hypothetical protein